MKFSRVFLKAFLVFAIILFAVAFKSSLWGKGTIYCKAACTEKIDYTLCPGGKVTDPCKNGAGGEYTKTGDGDCFEIAQGYHFCSTAK